MNQLVPQSAEDFFHLGVQRLQAGELREAQNCFESAVQRHPDFGEALANLAWLHEQNGDFEVAENDYRKAITLLPQSLQIHLNFGALLLRTKRFLESESVFRLALEIQSDSAAAWSNLGVLLACTKREEEAIACYRKAIALDSAYSKAWFNLSYVLLRQGLFEEGWRCLEHRELAFDLSSYFEFPRWRGEPLIGKSIVLGVEAGHGDMIQFCRYASVLKRLGARSVVALCQPTLVRLLRSLADVDEVLSISSDDVPKSGWDFWVPPMSVAHYCGTRFDTIPCDIPYLSVEKTAIEKWSQALPKKGLRVGLAWKGNPRFENDAERSLPSLQFFAPLASVPGCHFLSLQKDVGEDDVGSTDDTLQLIDLMDQCHDFADTAALIENLDLVITVDSAVAHLAGSLGKPCWVLLPDYRSDWRWLTDRNDSPWYPGQMRLFRQGADQRWEPVVDSLRRALEILEKQAHGIDV